jgi:hypothetical protein
MDLSRTYDNLCDTCADILDQTALDILQSKIDLGTGQENPSTKPHLTHRSLMTSAKGGCHLCYLLFMCLRFIGTELVISEELDFAALSSCDIQMYTRL